MGARTLPHNLDAEESVLGACLLNEKALVRAMEILQPEHFYRQSYGAIFKAMRTLWEQHVAVDPITVARELERTHELHALYAPRHHGFKPLNGYEREFACEEEARDELRRLAAIVPAASNVAHWARIVRDLWGKRAIISTFTPPMQGAWNGQPPQQVIRDVERALMELRANVEDAGDSRVVSALNAAHALQAKVANPPDARVGVQTPFSFLPRLQPGRLYVLGGYPKDGKTAVSAQFLKAACNDKKRVGYVSIEMSWEDLRDRVISTYGVPYGPLQNGIVAPAYEDAFKHGLAEFGTFDLDLIDDASVDAAEIARYQRVGQYDMLIIDYLQRMPYKDRLELNQVVKGITTVARHAQIPILLLSQFSRPYNVKGFPRPTMNSYAETSMIEKEAAMAMAIYRRRDEFDEPTDEAEFLVLANRYGAPSRHEMRFRGQEVRFVEVRP